MPGVINEAPVDNPTGDDCVDGGRYAFKVSALQASQNRLIG
jgi:hypothetical protein